MMIHSPALTRPLPISVIWGRDAVVFTTCGIVCFAGHDDEGTEVQAFREFVWTGQLVFL